MNFKGKRIGITMTGSFCTFSKVIEQIRELAKRGADIIPIMSFNSLILSLEKQKILYLK